MNTKSLVLLSFLLVTTSPVVVAQEKPITEVSPDDINKAVVKLIEYYESYDDGCTESQRKAKHDNAIEELTRGTATSKDKNDAYILLLGSL